jgi:photosystem II stability/assembly factor-like uncharacterized protein
MQFAPGQNRVYEFGFGSAAVGVSDDQGATWTDGVPIVDRGINDLAVSPTDANRLLIASSSGTYGSADGGQTWVARKGGQDELFHTGLAQRFPAGGTGHVYAYGYAPEGAFRRETNGQWTAIAANTVPLLGTTRDIPTLAVAPSDGTLYLARTGHFGSSTDGGANWTRRGNLGLMVRVVVDPGNSQTLYATDQGFNAVKSVDGGANWTPFGNDLPTDVADFAVNDTNGNRVYAVMRNTVNTVGQPLYVSNDAGATWTPSAWPYSNNFSGGVIAHERGSANTLYVGLSSGLFKTTDGGASWTQLNPYPATVTPDNISSISIDPRAPQTIYTATAYAYPAMRSVDGGANWEPLRALVDENLVDDIVVETNTTAGLVGRVTYGGLVETEIAPDLALTSGPTQVAGTAGSTTLTVTNNGVYTATAIRLTATLPGVTGTPTVQSTAGLTCALTGASLVCDAPLLRPAASVAATLGFIPAAAGQWQAALTARESDSAPANNSLSVTVQAAASNPPGGGNSGGGGGGGRLDYLLLALLGAAAFLRLARTR